MNLTEGYNPTNENHYDKKFKFSEISQMAMDGLKYVIIEPDDVRSRNN